MEAKQAAEQSGPCYGGAEKAEATKAAAGQAVSCAAPDPITVNDPPLHTEPERTRDQMLRALQDAGFYLNGTAQDPDKYVVTFEKPQQGAAGKGEPFWAKKAAWPQTPYIQADGPTIQLEREGLYQEKGFCGYKPPKCKSVKIHFRPADPNCGSALEKTFAYKEEGDLKRTSCGCCGLKPVDKWEFRSEDGTALEFVRERMKGGCCGCGGGQLPANGKVWRLMKDGSLLATMEAPKPPGGCCGCGGGPMVWLRISDAQGEALHAVREQGTGKKSCAKCCSGLSCGCGCLNCNCGALCGKCVRCPQLVCGSCFPGCCKEPVLVPVRAANGGIVSQELKGQGKAVAWDGERLEFTHDIKLEHPAIQATPGQEVMISFKFPGKPGVARSEEHFGTETALTKPSEGLPGKYIVNKLAVKPGTEVKAGDVVAYLQEQRNCCGVPGCPELGCCPTTNVCAKCAFSCARSCKCCPCIGPVFSCCCSFCSKEEPRFSFEPAPVTGEWATGDKQPYRVRSEVNATMAVGEAGQLVCNVEAGLEKGATEADHWAFVLAAFVEMVEDDRRPLFHVESGAPRGEGLPPRQQLMLE